MLKMVLWFQRFFGMIRNACGSNSHPDPLRFAQMYRLLSVYSLVKPPRGSNISGGDILQTLISKDDMKDIEEDSPMKTFISKLDSIVENGVNIDELHRLNESNDHDYVKTETGDFVLAYVSGFVARKAHTFTSCQVCLQTLVNITAEPCPQRDLLINLKSRGGLLHPSDAIFNLCSTLERHIMAVLTSQSMNSNVLYEIVDMLESIDIPKVGCEEHEHFLTVSVMKFYLIMSMNFVCNRYNEVHLVKREKPNFFKNSQS